MYLRTVLHGIGVIHGVVHYKNTVEERKCIDCCQKALTAKRQTFAVVDAAAEKLAQRLGMECLTDETTPWPDLSLLPS